MAEKVELNLREISLLTWTQVKKGFMEIEELKFFEQEIWKLFLSMIGFKLIEKYKDLIKGECLINFFPSEKEELQQLIEQQNTTLMEQKLVKPLFYIKFDKNQHIELIDRGEEKIPKKVMFMVLCRL